MNNYNDVNNSQANPALRLNIVQLVNDPVSATCMQNSQDKHQCITDTYNAQKLFPLWFISSTTIRLRQDHSLTTVCHILQLAKLSLVRFPISYCRHSTIICSQFQNFSVEYRPESMTWIETAPLTVESLARFGFS